MSKDTIRINSLVLTHHDWKTASANIRAVDNVVVVEMMPMRKSANGVLIASIDDDYSRDDIGMVMAACPSTGLNPGTYVAVRHKTGISYENFSAGAYKARNEVRIFGRTQTTGSNAYRVEKFSMPSYIHGRIKVEMFDIEFITPGQELPIHKRLSMDTYESYVRVSREVSPKTDQFLIADPFGKGRNSITLSPGFAYRVVVRSIGASIFNTVVEKLGDDSMEIAHLTDRELPLIAYGKKMVVELDELHDQSAGGIFLTDNEAFRSTKATVIQVGAHCDRDGAKVGDRVVCAPGSLGQNLEMTGINNKCLRLVPEECILTVLVGENDMTKRELDQLQVSA